MGVSVKYVQAHKAAGRLIYRRGIPAPLRPFVPGSPREFIRTLGAKSLSEPGAMDRYAEASGEFDRLTVLARKAQAHAFDDLDDGRIGFLAGVYLARRLSDDEDARLEAKAPDPERLENNEDAYRTMLSDNNPQIIRSVFEGEALALGQAHGLLLDPASKGFLRLCHKLIAAEMEANEVRQGRNAGVPLPTPAAPEAIATRAPDRRKVPEPRKSFASLVGSLLENEVGSPMSGTTRQATRTALRFWREAQGDVAPQDITRAMVTEFMELLLRRPTKPLANERDLALRTLVERYANKPDAPRQARKTVQQHLGMLAAIWNKLQERGDLGERELANPFGKRKIAQTEVAADNPELSPAELKALFALPIFTKGERPTRGKGEASYWIPLMLLWTGARPEEIAQLRLEDFTKDEETGRWLMRITNEGEHAAKGAMRLKTQRKGSGRRTFPVPTPLIDLGLIAYIEWLARAGETALFPLLRTKGARGNLYTGFGEWFSPMVKAAGVVPAGTRRPLRELRHNWTTEARRVEMPEDAREYIQGHSVAGKSANAGYGDRSPLGKRIDMIRFERLDLSGVRRWESPR